MVQEFNTTLSPADVVASAKKFFTRHNAIYAAFVEKEGPNYVTFRGQGTEEIVIAATPVEGGSAVRGSTYLFDMQVSRFFSTLPALGARTETITGEVVA
jgi:hypothetical protein